MEFIDISSMIDKRVVRYAVAGSFYCILYEENREESSNQHIYVFMLLFRIIYAIFVTLL